MFRHFTVVNLDGAVAYRKPAPPIPARPSVSRSRLEGEPSRVAIGGGAVVHTPRPGAEEAERLEALAEADPADGRAPLLAARIHLDRLELDRAERWAEVACQRDPLSAPAHYLRGLALQEAGRLEDALAALRRSVFLDPGSVLGQLALAGLLARLGEPARARGALRAAAALVGDGDPSEPIDGHEELPAGRVRDLIAAQLARLDPNPEVAR